MAEDLATRLGACLQTLPRLQRDVFLLRAQQGLEYAEIANALGKNKSFVSQITSPSYAVPVPEAHVDTIMTICHFSAEERAAFLAAYAAAHPERPRSPRAGEGAPYRKLHIPVPLFADPHTQHEVEKLIRSFAQQVIRLAKRSEE